MTYVPRDPQVAARVDRFITAARAAGADCGTSLAERLE